MGTMEIQFGLILFSAFLSVVSIVIALLAIIKYKNVYRKYDMFMRGRDAESLEELILNEKQRIQDLEDSDQANKEVMRNMNRNIRASYQKIGVCHYDAFEGMGGKMSFAMALLDYTNSGIVLNCMHGRDGCFIYVKDIEAGSTDTPLGSEEKEALERALGYIKD